MLTGTLVTAVGFVPVSFARSSAGEYTNSIFWVVGLSLVISWSWRCCPRPGRAITCCRHARSIITDPYGGWMYTAFPKLVVWCVTWRKSTIAITALAFVASLGAFTLVQKQFFPTANRPELIVDLSWPRAPRGPPPTAKCVAWRSGWARTTTSLSITSYVGAGSPRFYLPTVPELSNANFGQVIVMTKDLTARERVVTDLNQLFASASRRCAPACSACRMARRSATR